ncbi:MAG: hypothetical protein LBR37_02975 [Erysipelotrichaceae bacterium]|jgi:hypothetical protein|nr:hypothetical protein [Erysipelotrichaceae bacterium]
MKRIKDFYHKYGLSYKKPLLTHFLAFVVLVLIVIFTILFDFPSIYIMFAIFLWGFLVVQNVLEISNARRVYYEKRIADFTVMLSYLLVYLHNHFSFYRSFELVREFSNEELKNDITIFLNDSSHDSSVRPYQDFADKYPNENIERFFRNIYLLNKTGEQDFQGGSFYYELKTFISNNKEHQQRKQVQRIESMGNTALVGSVFSIIIITIGVFLIIGDKLSGF